MPRLREFCALRLRGLPCGNPSMLGGMPLALTVSLLLSVLATPGSGQDVNQAGLVIVHGDGRVVTRCIAFAEAEITGYDLVQRAGLDLNVEATGLGATICRLDGEGCAHPEQSCFCQCEGATCEYWSYWEWDGAAWQYNSAGASNHMVKPGAVDGWVWGPGTVDNAQPPPQMSFAAICAAPTATPAVTDTPTATPTWTVGPTATFFPTALPTGTPSPIPTAIPTWTPSPTLSPMPTAVSFTATPQAPLPVVKFIVAEPKEITGGESFVLRWQVDQADSAQLQADSQEVPVPVAGELTLAPIRTTTYLLVATNGAGSASAGLTVVVRPKVDLTQTPTVAAIQPVPAGQPPVVEALSTLFVEPANLPPPASIGSTPLVAQNATASIQESVPTPTMAETTAPVALNPTAAGISVLDRPTEAESPNAFFSAASSRTMLLVVSLIGLAGLFLSVVVAVLAAWIFWRSDG